MAATDLDDAIKRKQLEDSWRDDPDPDPADEAPADQDVTYPTIAEDQPSAPDFSDYLVGAPKPVFETESQQYVGADVGFGPGIAPPEISQEAERQRQTPTSAFDTVTQETLPSVEAPAQLDQVERAEPVEAPAKLDQVERAELVDPDPDAQYFKTTPDIPQAQPVDPKAELIDPDPDAQYLKQAAPSTDIDPGIRLTPEKYRELTGRDVSPGDPGLSMTPEQYKALTGSDAFPGDPGITLSDEALKRARTQPSAPSAAGPAKPAGPDFSAYLVGAPKPAPSEPAPSEGEPSTESQIPLKNAPDGQAPAALIIHHTSGRGDAASVVEDWRKNRPGVGAQYVMDRDGVIHDVEAEFGYTGHGHFLHSVVPGVSNQTAVGIEVIAKDDADMTPAQLASLQRFAGPGGPYANTPVYGHSQVSPDDRENEGVRGVKAINEARAAGVPPTPADQAARAQPGTLSKSGFYPDEKPDKDFVLGRATVFGTAQDIATGQDSGVGSPKLGQLNTSEVYGVAIPQEALIAQFGNNPKAWRSARAIVVDPSTGKRMLLPIVDIGPGEGPQDAGVAIDFTLGTNKLFGGTGNKGFYVKLVPNAGPDVNKDPSGFADEQAAIRQGVDLGAVGKAQQAAPPMVGGRAMTDDEAAAAQQKRQELIQGQKDTLSKLPEAQSGNIIGLYKRLDQTVDGVSNPIRQQAQAGLKPQIIAAMQEKFPGLSADDAWNKALATVGPVEVAQDWWSKMIGGFMQYGTVMKQGSVGNDRFNVDQFLSKAMPGAGDADKQNFLTQLYALPPDERMKLIASKLPPVFEGMGAPVATPSTDPLQISNALDRMANPKLQEKQQQELSDLQNLQRRNLSSDPRLTSTGMGRVINDTAPILSQMVAFENPAMWPMALAQIQSVTQDELKAEHPDWDDKKLAEESAKSTTAQFIGSAAASKLWAGGGEALMGALQGRGQRAIAQVLLGVGGGAAINTAVTGATNVLTGEPITKGMGGAALTGAIQGLVPGLVHGARERFQPRTEAAPPVAAPERPVEPAEPSARSVPPTEPVQPPVAPPEPVVPRGAPERAVPPLESVIPREEPLPPPAPIPPEQPVTREDVNRRAFEIYQEREQAGVPGDAMSDWTQAQAQLATAKEPLPATMGESEPIVSAIANRYTAERMARGELGQIDPSQGTSTEALVMQGLTMSPAQRETLIDNFTKGKGGDLDQQGAAIRAKEAYLSEAARAASRTAQDNPENQQLATAAKTAFDEVTAFHNGPLKKFKQVWSDSGRALQQELPIDYTTFNGMKEAYLKANGQSPPEVAEPALQKMADRASGAVNAEKVAMNKFGQAIDGEVKRRGKLPADDQVRARLAEIMKDFPCPT